MTLEWATVGNPGNPGEGAFAGDTSNYGSVGYVYQISKHEVTNSQYAEFLNAKAASDPSALYNTNMGSDANGGITRAVRGQLHLRSQERLWKYARGLRELV